MARLRGREVSRQIQCSSDAKVLLILELLFNFSTFPRTFKENKKTEEREEENEGQDERKTL